MVPRWSRPPEVDETGRLAPEERARARRRVLRSLLAILIVAVAAGLLAYGCNRLKSDRCCAKASACQTCPATPAPSPTTSG